MNPFKKITKINWRNVQLVRFSDGKYGVRKGRLIYFYKSKNSGLWFTKFSDIFTGSCQMTYTEAVIILRKETKPITDTVIHPKENDQH